ncbi:MAG TPA: SIMPL domain-containing protein [Solirubrobacteraceae bacterium]|nr:SIMPL domain-containing protein [Solirubrobacteraceae bacterium]
MRLALAIALSAAAALFVANMLGVAVAEAPTTASLRTVAVEGVATVPIGQKADAASANAAYRQAMAAAVSDGQSKAEYLTGRVGATLGAVQSVGEGGGGIECFDSESEYVQYEGERPDFGRAPQYVQAVSAPAASAAPAAPRRTSTKKRRRHRRPLAKKATAPGCKLSAQVSLVYVIG